MVLAALLWPSLSHSHECPAPVQSDVRVEFVTSDIELFWRALDQSTPASMPAVLEREYLRQGSRGLAEFTRLRIGDGAQLAAVVQAHPAYYAALRKSSRRVEEFKPVMRRAFQCLRAIYPEAVMPTVTFVIGRMNSAGTVDARNLLIGVDMFGKSDEAVMEGLGRWHRAVVAPMERLPYIVAHELIHAQQTNAGGGTLLAAALNEGVADFVGQLISGETINPHLHAFARERHAELWRDFEKDMNGRELGRWLYQGDSATGDRPADLGYYIGYRIAEAYYQQHRDKHAAVREMLAIRDPQAFLAASGYAEKVRGQ